MTPSAASATAVPSSSPFTFSSAESERQVFRGLSRRATAQPSSHMDTSGAALQRPAHYSLREPLIADCHNTPLSMEAGVGDTELQQNSHAVAATRPSASWCQHRGRLYSSGVIRASQQQTTADSSALMEAISAALSHSGGKNALRAPLAPYPNRLFGVYQAAGSAHGTSAIHRYLAGTSVCKYTDADVPF